MVNGEWFIADVNREWTHNSQLAIHYSSLILKFLIASVNNNKVIPVNINVCFKTLVIPRPFIITANTIS